MNIKKLYWLGLLGCLLVTSVFAQQPAEEWARRYDNGSLADEAIDIAVDATGDSYVTGVSLNGSTGQSRIVTIRYSPAGEEVWVRVHEGDFSSAPAAIAIDGLGGVYITGFSRNQASIDDYLTIRYNASDGTQSWVSRYDGPAGGDDRASAITADNAGGIFVTGSSAGDGTSGDFATIRYNASDGTQSWVSRYDAGNRLPGGYSDDEATAIATDKAGGVFVTGYSRGLATFNDFATMRYDAATGVQSWVSRYDGGFSEDQVWAIATDVSGGVFVAGYSLGGNTIDDLDFTTLGYDAATGAQRWVSRYDGGSNDFDEARAIATDGQGGVYVTGNSFGEHTAPALVTFRYDAATGAQVWMSRQEAAGGEARAIAVDSLGGVYITGSGLSAHKYSAADGALVWDAREAGSGGWAALALDAAGNVYLGGFSLGASTGRDFLTVKYSQQDQCPDLTEAAIEGSATAMVNSTGSAYTLSAAGATSFTWSITGSDGHPYTDFAGQGTNSIAVDWPQEPDVYKVSVTYGGSMGCPSRAAVLYAYLFDPAAGFVSGGGWSASPAVPGYELMSSGGKMYWGFAARYKKGSHNRVQGAVLILLESELAVFRGSSVQDGTLVVSGNRAFFRGHGTLMHYTGLGTSSDERRFGYLLAATDGQFGADTGPDKLRLRIWVINQDGSDGDVVFDSQAGCPSANLDDNAAACTAVERGEVVIRRRNTWNLFASHALALGEEPQGAVLQVYPTTASDKVTVSFTIQTAGAYSLDIYDLKGVLVRRLAAGSAEVGKHHEQELLLEDMDNGLYLVRLTTASGMQTAKFVVE